jgi:hypothetical protein
MKRDIVSVGDHLLMVANLVMMYLTAFLGFDRR